MRELDANLKLDITAATSLLWTSSYMQNVNSLPGILFLASKMYTIHINKFRLSII